ncbi:unnamed protein product, partial [Prorocentrum cordatum]
MARGVDSLALPGEDFCAAHRPFGMDSAGVAAADPAAAAPAAVAESMDTDDDTEGSGLTQAAEALQLAGAPVAPGLDPPAAAGAHPAGIAAAAAASPAALPSAGQQSGSPQLLLSVHDFQELLEAEALQYVELVQAGRTASEQHRTAVSFPGTWPDLKAILGKLAYRLDDSDPWADRVLANQADVMISAAAAHCEACLPDVRMARRQLRPDRLPQWKELGGDALAAIRALPGAEGHDFLTQWSQVLDPRGRHAPTVERHRRLSDLLEKGDARFLQEMRGQQLLAWAPADTGALQRILSQFLRRASTEAPTSMLLITPLPFFPGAATMTQILDLWHHPLLGEKHAAIVQAIHLLPQPLEYILPGLRGPRHVRQGLACFRIARTGPRSPPAIVLSRTPLLKTTGSDSVTIDTPLNLLPTLMSKLATLEEFRSSPIRDPTRSIGSTNESPRTSVELLLPPALSQLGKELLVRRLQRSVLSQGMLIGHRSLYVAEDAMILECLSPAVMLKAWPLCSEALFLTPNKLLVRTDASAETWTQLMDGLCREGELSLITKLRWKSSRTEINLKAFDGIETTPSGFWKHLASYDPACPPGRARLYLANHTEVGKVHEALHGQVLQVGDDWLAISGQYLGKLSLTIWNTQALFAADGFRHRDKSRHVHRLMATHDVGVWSESHGTADRGALWREPPGCTSWWSPGPSSGTAGVGITVKTDFFKLFARRVHFEIIFPGRAAVLRLDGGQGSLDIYTVYFHTGDSTPAEDVVEAGFDPAQRVPSNFELREALRHRLARRLRPCEEALSILGGGFHHVLRPPERVCISTGAATGHRGHRDATSWRTLVEVPYGIHELYQPEHTYAAPDTRARLDRVCCNQYDVEYLDKACACTALAWCPELSRHRPLSFRKCPAQPRADRPAPLGDQALEHPDFPRQVTLAWQELLHNNPDAHALTRLQLLKQAMRQAELALASQVGSAPPAEQLDDRIGVCMKFLRASEACSPERISRCLERYPLLRDMVANPYDFTSPPGPRLARVRSHVMELQRDFTMQELNRLHEDLRELEPAQAARRRRRNQQLVCKLAPGRSCQHFALDAPTGEATTDPQEMLGILRGHWSEVFRRKDMDTSLLDTWLREDAQHLPADYTDHLPHLAVPRRAFRQAIRKSGNSAPGRDGIPFKAWRKIVDLATDAFHEAFEAMIAPTGLDMVQEAWHDFNESVMVFLPKKPTSTRADGTA